MDIIGGDLSTFVIAIIAAALPLPLLKSYHKTQNKVYIAMTAVSYLVLIMIYATILEKYQMSTVYPFLKIGSVLLVAVIGITIYHEKLTVGKVIGIILGCISLYLLLRNNKTNKIYEELIVQ